MHSPSVHLSVCFTLVALTLGVATAGNAPGPAPSSPPNRPPARPAVTVTAVPAAGIVPRNPALADTPWPIYHANSGAQAATPLRGPEPSDRLEVTYLPTGSKTVSCWSLLGERYPDGTRALFGSTLTHVFKARVGGDVFEMVDSEQVYARGSSIMWNLLVLEDNRVIVADRRGNRLMRWVEQRPGDPASPLRMDAEFRKPRQLTPGGGAQFSVTYDGTLIYSTDDGHLGAVSQDFRLLATFDLKPRTGEVFNHNAFPIDDAGGIYLLSSERMVKVRWDARARAFQKVWEAPYDFRGPAARDRKRGIARDLVGTVRGEEGTGSGTTPTLMGPADGHDDRLVVVVDGHTPNNLVAFWRDDIPPTFRGLPGQDRRIAAVVPIPLSTPAGRGFTAENSPPVLGYGVAVAQWQGFNPPPDPLPGVTKLVWNPATDTFAIAWENRDVQLNGVMTVSAGSRLLYSSGRRAGVYTFYGLDWDTGTTRIAHAMGRSDDFKDQGNGLAINDDRSALFGTVGGIVRVRPLPKP